MSVFLIPMAGLSSRFFKAGYDVPKYQLRLDDKSMFLWSVESFKRYFTTDKFVFVCRDVYNTPSFILNELKTIAISDFDIVILDSETLGQADTVYQGLTRLSLLKSHEDLYIFNIDSRIESFEKPKFCKNLSVDGFLDVFQENGEHWSFVEPGDNYSVLRTTEKVRISNLCSTGLYYFRKISDFAASFESARDKKDLSVNELYIAPLYNILIQDGKLIKYRIVPRERVIICGTPVEYEGMKAV